MSCCRDEELKQQRRRHLSIERELKIERKAFRNSGSRLLLHGDETKQTEFISLLKTYPQKELNEQQRLLRVPEIVRNIVDIITSLSASLKQPNTTLEKSDIAEKLDQISQTLSSTTSNLLLGALLELSQLCMDPSIQSYMESTVEGEVHPSAAYFLSPRKLREIAEPHYVPSDEDIANCKERPSTIVEIAVTFVSGPQVYCKVPKLPLNSKIYRHLGIAAHLTAVVYVIDCGGIDEYQHQGSTSTKLMAAIADFEVVWKTRWLYSTSIILLMIGLRYKIGNLAQLERYYPEYSYYSPPEFVGENDEYEKVKHFIMTKIKHVTRNNPHPCHLCYTHFIDAIDETTLRKITFSCSDIRQRQHLWKYMLL